jgi:hypothetical protein
MDLETALENYRDKKRIARQQEILREMLMDHATCQAECEIADEDRRSSDFLSHLLKWKPKS